VRNALLLAVVVALLAGLGCSGDPDIRSHRVIHVFPQPENTFEEDVSARKGHPSPPNWLYNPGKFSGAGPGRMYFAGIGLPKVTLQAARDSAMEDARRQIVRYMGTTVGVKSERTGTAMGDTRGGSYETVTDEVFSASVANHTVKGVAIRDAYYTAGMMVQGIAKRRVNIAYLLAEFGSKDVGQIIKNAEVVAEKEIKVLEDKKAVAPAKKLQERDAARLDSLRRLEKKLDNLNADDFSL
jgi:hypothetical protein